FPGFCALLLATFALVRAPRDARVAVRVCAAMGIVGCALSLGPEGIRPIYSALYNTVAGMQAVRAPARFSVLVLAAIAALAAIAVRGRGDGWPRPWGAGAAAALAIVTLESFNGAIAYPPAPPMTTAAGSWLKDHPGTGAVVCAPMAFDASNTPCMLQSL